MSGAGHRMYEWARVDTVIPWGRSAECYEMDRITSFSAGGGCRPAISDGSRPPQGH